MTSSTSSSARIEYRNGHRHAWLGDVPDRSSTACRGSSANTMGSARDHPSRRRAGPHRRRGGRLNVRHPAWPPGRAPGCLRSGVVQDPHERSHYGHRQDHSDSIHPRQLRRRRATGTREATELALTLHPQGCPAYQSVKGAIEVTWDAVVRVGDETVHLTRGDPSPE